MVANLIRYPSSANFVGVPTTLSNMLSSIVFGANILVINLSPKAIDDGYSGK
jgi:hypothetical protein